MFVKSSLIKEKLERSSLVRPSSDFVRNNLDARFAGARKNAFFKALI